MTSQPSSTPALTEAQASDLLINWDVATSSAGRLAPPGPQLSAAAAADEVAALRQAAADSIPHVHQITGLDAAQGLGDDLSDVYVVDRPGWSEANTTSFRQILAPAMKTLLDQKPHLAKDSPSRALGSTVAGGEFGAVLAFLSANVLGQFDPFHTSEAAPAGRLLLVAPNVVDIAQQLNVERDDFRLWVCLHEQTHRVQFAAAPWLAGYLRDAIHQLTTSTMGQADSLPEKLMEAAKNLREELGQKKSGTAEAAEAEGDDAETGGTETGSTETGSTEPGSAGPDRPEGSTDSGSAGAKNPASSTRRGNRLLEALQTPEDRALMSQITAVMSLLEGHANVVMDSVDSSIVPTVKTIRRRFEERGQFRSPLERAIRRLLQLDVKAAQYRDGQKFVDHIVAAVGMEEFNTVWQAPEHLPTEEELHDPDRWIERMELPR